MVNRTVLIKVKSVGTAPSTNVLGQSEMPLLLLFSVSPYHYSLYLTMLVLHITFQCSALPFNVSPYVLLFYLTFQCFTLPFSASPYLLVFYLTF